MKTKESGLTGVKKPIAFLMATLLLLFLLPGVSHGEETLSLSMETYRDKVRGAWLGKMVGVSVGILREFWYRGEIMPREKVSKWDESLLSLASIEDDLYIPFALLKEMDEKGIDISDREMTLALYPYSFEFWDGHQYTWELGIAPPDAGHPAYAPFPDGLSYSFASDYSGLIAPGRPDIPTELAQRFGSTLVYGDGIYGGAFIGAMYSKAFFETDLTEIVKAGLEAVPCDSWLYESISDVLLAYEKDPSDWESAWHAVTDKYFWNEHYNWIQWPYGGRTEGIDLDVKLNCAYLTIALLYGGGDIERTLNLAIRCGQDCDSNAANALGVLFAVIGFENIPYTYQKPLATFPPFRYVNGTFEELCAITERVFLEEMKHIGATVTDGWVEIPTVLAEPGKAVNSKKPAPLTGSLFTAEEMNHLERQTLQNGGFEEDWTDAIHLPWHFSGRGSAGIDIRKGKAYNGFNNAWICAENGQEAWISQHRVRVQADTSYVLSAAVRSSGNVEKGFIRIIESGSGGNVIAEIAFGSQKEYTVIAVPFHWEKGHVDVQVGYAGPAGASWLHIDEVILSEGGA